MKKNFFRAIALGWPLFLFSNIGHTATFTVTPTSDNDCTDFNCDLQSALNTSANNGEGDTLNLQSGIYNVSDNGGNPFTYTPAATENFPISLIGASGSKPVLDGNNLDQALSLDTTGVTAPDDANADMVIQGLVVRNGNSPVTGGGMAAFANDANITVDACSFLNNRNNTGYAGGMDIETLSGVASLTNSNFDGNTSANGIGGAGIFTTSGNMVVMGNSFTDNTATDSVGGVDAAPSTGSLLFSGNLVSGNTAANMDGGAELASAGPVTVTNNIFIGNTATNDDRGGAEIFGNTTIDIVNNTFSGNTSGSDGGGIVAILNGPGVANFYNNIVWGNSAVANGKDILINNPSGGTINLFNNDFSDLGCDVGGCGTIVNSPSNIDQDPLFVDLAGGNVELLPGSPCIDSATASAPSFPNVDFAGNPRNVGLAPDMGALESLPILQVSPTSHDFGAVNVNQDASTIITLSNTGPNVLNVTGMSLSDNQNYFLNFNGGSSPCGSATPTLDTGDSCTVEVIFEPSTAGILPAILTITSNDPTNPALTVTLSGTGSFFAINGGGCTLGANPFSAPGLSIYGIYLIAAPLAIALRKRLAKR